MSSSESSLRDGVIFQLAISLDQYEIDVAAMVQDWPVTAACEAAGAGIDSIRAYSGTVPALAGPSVSLVIAHAELVQAMWRPVADPAKMKELLEVHQLGVRTLRRHCLRALTARTIGLADQ